MVSRLPDTLKLDGQYSQTDVANMLGVDWATVYRWRMAGTMRFNRHRHNKRPFVYGREVRRFFIAER